MNRFMIQSIPLVPQCRGCLARGRRSGFTLIELIVVIGILISLATLTAISVSKVTKDARFSKAVSQVMNALENARTLAIKEHRPVLLAFTVKTDRVDNNTPAGILTGNIKKQWTRIVAARLSDELVIGPGTSSNSGTFYNDMFEPHPNFAPVDLPEGIKVAGPLMDFDRRDEMWTTQPTFRDSNTNFSEMEYGYMLGILFGSDGELLTRITRGGSTINSSQGRNPVLDLDQNGIQSSISDQNDPRQQGGWYTYNMEGEEPYVQLITFLAVFNDAAMRELYDVNNWKGPNAPDWNTTTVPCSTYNKGRTRMNCDESEFINQFGEKIYFNTYTGRAEVFKR